MGGNKAGVFSLEFYATIGALFDLGPHFGITLGAHRHLGVRVHHQTALGALGGTFGNRGRKRRADTL